MNKLEADKHVVIQKCPNGIYHKYEKVLCEGSYSTIYLAYDTRDGTERAWHSIRVHEMAGSSADEDRSFVQILCMEALHSVLKKMQHTNILRVYDSWMDTKEPIVHFICDLSSSQSLRTYRAKHKDITPDAVCRWGYNICQGLAYLHAQQPSIIHCALTPESLTVDAVNGCVRIGDAEALCRSLAQCQGTGRALIYPKTSSQFMAPEMYDSEYSTKSDIYSFGMCMLELATGEVPYSECDTSARVYHKKVQRLPPDSLTTITDPQLRDLIINCTSSDPSSRPDITSVLQHTFFSAARKAQHTAHSTSPPSSSPPQASLLENVGLLSLWGLWALVFILLLYSLFSNTMDSKTYILAVTPPVIVVHAIYFYNGWKKEKSD